MINPEMLKLGTERCYIRELAEYGAQQAKIVGREHVYDFSIGNPSVPAPQAVKEAFLHLIDEVDALAVHSYTAAPGMVEARAAVAEDLNRRYGTDLRAENFFFTYGASAALTAVIRALAVPGAELLAMAPYFPEYRPFAENNGMKFVVVPAEETFQIPLQALEERITPHTQAVLVNSPNNPSGVVYSRSSLESLAGLLEKKSREIGHPIYIIADEPYRELVYDGTEVPFIPTIYPNTVVCYSYSKSLSLPGERIGYFCVPDQAQDSRELWDAAAGAARAMGHICAPSLQQRVVALCAGCRPDLESYDRSRMALYTALTAYGYECIKPTGAFYMFVKAPEGDGRAFSDRAKAKNLLVAPGEDFGCPAYFRVSTCVDTDMIRRSLPVFRALMDEA